MSRFLLDLQEANQTAINGSNGEPGGPSLVDDGSLNFARVIGSIGASIEPQFDQDEFGGDSDEYEVGDGQEATNGVVMEGVHYV